MRATLKFLAIGVFGLVAGMLLLELGIRAYMALQPLKKEWSDRPNFYFAHELAPAAQDLPHRKVKPADTYRIAVVGDSFTFAPYMQFTDAFPHKLEAMLNLNDTALKGEVINYGVPAYSLSHEVAVVRRAVEEQADLIILQVTLNDPEMKPYRPTGIQTNLADPFGVFRPQQGPEWLFKYWKTAMFVAERLHNSRTHTLYQEYFKELFNNPRSWKKYLGALGKIEKICKRAEVPVVAVVFPLFGLPTDQNYPFWDIHTKVAEALTDHGIPYRDLLDIYSGIPLERLQVMPGVDRHPNEIAHRMAAEAIYVWLAQNKFLPEELLIKVRYKTRYGIAHQAPYKE
ncbi:MAG: SGNH/GDSL hydrolase family protein [Bdellovibrionales bacterium]|nr:SGNH/GDSL hydrolase family protein [Bdellovibrionales bacterium]